MFTIEEILEATGGRLIEGNRRLKVCGVSTDSRTIRPKELFIAIRGERFDGHNFVAQARRRQAGAVLFSDISLIRQIQRRKGRGSVPMIKVKDTVLALGGLAYRHRAKFNIPVIAITGSNGKTTTKEMLSAILDKRFNVLRNAGTQNNHIGVPLTILKLRKEHSLAVIEIGANHKGEVDRLSWMLQPSVGIITNIGAAHLEFFKSLTGVFKAKLELIRNLPAKGKLIINKDDRFLSRLNGNKPQTVTFGLNRLSAFYAGIINQTEKATTFLLNNKYSIVVNTLGRHNVYNALASIACARSFAVSYRQIKDALAAFQPPAMRMQLAQVNGVKIINDCYNANPGSWECALDFLREFPSPYPLPTGERVGVRGRKIIVCADMLELGAQAQRFHTNIGKRIARGKIDFLITVGPLAGHIARAAYKTGMPRESIRTYHNCRQASRFLGGLARVGDVVLIKGSRATKMENILKCFTGSSTH